MIEPTMPRRTAFFFLDVELLGGILRLPPGTKIKGVRVDTVEGQETLRITVVSPTLKTAIPRQIPQVKPCWMKKRDGATYFLSWYSGKDGTDQGVMDALNEFLREMRSLSDDKELEPVMDYFSPEFEKAHMEVEEHLVSKDLEESLYSKQTWAVKTQLFFTEIVRRRERFNQLMAEKEKEVEELIRE